MRGPPITPPEHSPLDTALCAAARGDEGLFFVTDDENETFLAWSEVETRARHFASGLAACGIVAGDRVALVLPTAPSFPTAFFGTILAGGIPVPLYPPLRLGRLAEYHSSTVAMTVAVAARMIITDTRVLHKSYGPKFLDALPVRDIEIMPTEAIVAALAERYGPESG